MANKKSNKITNISSLQVPSTNLADMYIKKIIYDGEAASKKPITILAALEDNNQKLRLVTWDYNLIDKIKELDKNKHVCEMTFSCQEYRDTISYKLMGINESEVVSKHINDDEEAESNTQYYNKELYEQLLQQIQNKRYQDIIKYLIIDNKDFFVWPAAKTIHHAFEGGLAKHSYNVTVNAINLANTYESQLTLNYDLLIAGAMLHDIGKLKEYTRKGDISQLGNFLSHLVIGVEMIDDACHALNINSMDDDIVLLKHIIVSHHNKLEYGSPNRPILPEAYMISYADSNDAEIESMTSALYEMNTNDISKQMKSLDDGKLLKLY